MFLRGVLGNNPELDTDGTPILDPDVYTRTFVHPGGNTGNNVGSVQWDAIRNITGSFNGSNNSPETTKAFFSISANNVGTLYKTDHIMPHVIFDASRVVPTGGDNRPKNVYVNYIIKY